MNSKLINNFLFIFSERVYVRDKDSQQFLLQVAKDISDLRQDKFLGDLKVLREVHPVMAEFVQFCCQEYGTDSPFPEGVSTFISSLAKTSPACSLIPPLEKLICIIEKMISSLEFKSSASDLLDLSGNCPILFGLLQELHDTKLPVPLGNLLKDILHFVVAPFLQNNEPCSDNNADCSYMEKLAYFPALPVIRNRGVFTADFNTANCPAPTKVCRKKSSRHPTLLPGIFTLFCGHGKCLQMK